MARTLRNSGVGPIAPVGGKGCNSNHCAPCFYDTQRVYPEVMLMPAKNIRTASRFRTNLIGLYMTAMAILLAYIVYALFPERVSNTDGQVVWRTTITFFNFSGDIQPETRLLLLVMAMGALGSYIHAGTSFVSYVGNRSFVESWTWWYVLRPFIGLALAIIFYFVIRGGLLSAGAVASDISPFGFAAVAGLVGMFSKQATDKLEEVFGNLFQVSKEGGDSQRGDKLGTNRPVEEKMIPLSRMTAYKLTAPDDQTMLSDIFAICGPGITRIPVLDDAGILRYLIHRSLLTEFMAGHKGQPTLADLVQDIALRSLIFDAIAFVALSATVGDAKAAMDTITKCQDVIITPNGMRDEPVVGWLTNVDLGRLTRV